MAIHTYAMIHIDSISYLHLPTDRFVKISLQSTGPLSTLPHVIPEYI